ncbi:hypothetical protein ACF0H5_018180 [Mactra antiquata]
MLSLLFLTSVITLVSCGVVLDPPPTTQPPPTLSPEQIRLNDYCAARCVGVEQCFLASNYDPRYFIQCKNKVGVLRICGHGACFDPHSDSCVNAPESNCSTSLCVNKRPNERFDHDDNNCKTFWECSPSGKAVAKCCYRGYLYNSKTTECVPMIGNECMDTCDDKDNEPPCTMLGRYNDFANDGNCRTYHECENGVATVACCPQGERYDIEAAACVADVNNLCTSDCPLKSCKMQGVNSYSDPTYCGAYYVCNGTMIQEKRCCPGSKVYDDQVETCVEPSFGVTKKNCTNLCPQTNIHDCPLVGVDGGVGFRHLGSSEVINCSIGTLFEESTCACSGIIANPINNACSMEIDLTMTGLGLLRNGTERSATITQYGLTRPGKVFKDGIETMLFSGLVLVIPFFRSPFKDFYIQIVYKPESIPLPGRKMVLVSNCYQDAQNAATIEVALGSDGFVTLTVIVMDANSQAPKNPVTLSVPFQPTVWNKYKAYLHKNVLQVVNNGGTPLTTFEDSTLVPDVTIVQASEGLEIGGCISHGAEDVLVDTFEGSIAKAQLSKCVRNEWTEPTQPTAV